MSDTRTRRGRRTGGGSGAADQRKQERVRMTGPRLDDVPNALMMGGPRVRVALMRWLESRGRRPTFAQLQDERARRKAGGRG